MKKLLLTTMFIAAFGWMTNAQTWDFSGTDDGWTGTNCDLTTGADALTLTFTGKNPILSQSAANIDANNVHIFAITLKNLSEDGPTYLRVSYPKLDGSGKRVYKYTDITNGDSDFKTYYIDLTNSNWSGTVNDLQLHFKNEGNSTFTGTGAEKMDIDKIEILSAYPETEKHVYTFDTDGDTENWSGSNGTIDGVAGGILTFSPTADKYAKLQQNFHYVVADDVNWLRVVLKNNSTSDDTITFICSAGRIAFPVTTEDNEFKTYEILLDTLTSSGVTSWTGNIDEITLRFDGSGNGGKSSGTGSFEIDKIEFYHGSSTRISKHASYKLSLGPNPSNGEFRLNSEKPIAGYTVFNTAGQVVKQVNSLSSLSVNVDMSGGNRGLYYIKVNYESGESQVVKALVK